MGLVTKTFESDDEFKASLAKGGGGGGGLWTVPKDGKISVRFLTEPTSWVQYYEVYDPSLKYSVPLTDDMVTDEKPSTRYAAPVIDIDNDMVKVMKLPKSLVDALFTIYSENGTIVDRIIDLRRTGDGLDTRYSAMPDRSPSPAPDKEYEVPDLLTVLQAEADRSGGEDPDNAPF